MKITLQKSNNKRFKTICFRLHDPTKPLEKSAERENKRPLQKVSVSCYIIPQNLWKIGAKEQKTKVVFCFCSIILQNLYKSCESYKKNTSKWSGFCYKILRNL